MNAIDQIKKHYDKLTTSERFALMIAADERNDKADLDALRSSTPRKMWNVTTTYGLLHGFEFMSMWYMMEQLGYAMTMYFVMDGKGPGRLFKSFKDKGVKISFDEFLGKTVKRLVVNSAAWRRLCDEYKIDSEAFVKPLPYYEFLQLVILIALKVATEAKDMPTDEEITAALDDMRATVQKFRNDWE